VPLGYSDVHDRLFDLSFDPYHCVERRWGATAPGELASCKDGSGKRAWYQAEQGLRNQTERTYDVRMDFSLAQLRSGVSGSGKATPPDIDVESLLASPAAQIRAEIRGTVQQ